jgi:cycloeucalenol cycloisomerase
VYAARVQLLSANPSKRWAELFLLAYSPIWIAAITFCELTRVFAHWGDAGHLAFGLALALPIWIVPLLFPGAADRALPLAQRHIVRFNFFILVWTFVQVWFGSDLFFDFLGMEYHFPVTWTAHRTPVFLYPVTIAYFSTYYAVMQIIWRAFRTRFPSAPFVANVLVLVAIGYCVAFMETSGMATDMMRDYFRYRDKHFTLLYGSLCYGTIFVVSLPLVYRLDENKQPDGTRTLASLFWDACAANTVVLIFYAAYAAFITHPR